MTESPRKRASNTRAQTPALLKGLLWGPDGAAFSPTHTRKKNRLYRFNFSSRHAAHRACPAPCIDSTLVKALGRAFRWKRMLESGEFTTVTELAEHEKLGFSYLTRVLRLSLSAPDIVEAILEGRLSPEMKLADQLERFSMEWDEQNEQFA